MRSIYCNNCRELLGSNQKLTSEQAETVKNCKCVHSSMNETDKKCYSQGTKQGRRQK